MDKELYILERNPSRERESDKLVSWDREGDEQRKENGQPRRKKDIRYHRQPKIDNIRWNRKTAPSRMGRAPMPRVLPRALGVTFSRILPFPDSVSFFLAGSAPGYLPLEKTFHSCSLRRAWGVESNPGNSKQPLLNYN